MTTAQQKTKGLRIATRCSSLDQFVAAFHRFCDEQSFFVSTLSTRPVGLETAFSVDLVGGQPALRGLGVVLDAWTTNENKFGRPGVHLGIRRLTADAEKVFEQLLIARAVSGQSPVSEKPAPVPPAKKPFAIPPIAKPPAAAAPPPKPPAASPAPPVRPSTPSAIIAAMPSVIVSNPPPEPAITTSGEIDPNRRPPRAATPPPEPPEPPARAPASDFILPANPLTGISDESLEGFVDCTIFEETGNFFVTATPAEDPQDPAIDPPLLAPNKRAPTPVPTPVPVAPAPSSSADVQVTDDGAAVIVSAPPPPAAFAPAYPVYPAAPVYPAPPPYAPPSRRKLYLAAGIAGAAVLTLVIILLATSHSGAAATKTAAPTERGTTPPSPPIAAVQAQAPVAVDTTGPTAPTPPATPDETDPPDAPTSGAGAGAVVGKGPCQFKVATTPAGSTVAVDGQNLGVSPLTVAGPCQKRQLTVTHTRYAPVTRWVAPTTGKIDAVELVLPRPTHKLMIETSPLGATIAIDGRRAGTSPTVVELMGFSTMTVSITKPGYAPVTKRVYSRVANDKLVVKLTKR